MLGATNPLTHNFRPCLREEKIQICSLKLCAATTLRNHTYIAIAKAPSISISQKCLELLTSLPPHRYVHVRCHSKGSTTDSNKTTIRVIGRHLGKLNLTPGFYLPPQPGYTTSANTCQAYQLSKSGFLSLFNGCRHKVSRRPAILQLASNINTWKPQTVSNISWFESFRCISFWLLDWLSVNTC